MFFIIQYYIFPGGGLEAASLFHLCFENTEGLPIAGGLWFLTALFFTNTIYFLLDRYIINDKVKNVLVILLTLFGHVAAELFTYRLPYALDAALVGIGLFHIAYFIKQHMQYKYVAKLFEMNQWKWFVSGIIVTILIFSNGCVGMRIGEYAFLPLFWINAIAAIILGINFSIYLSDIEEKETPILSYIIHELAYVGENSMIYVVLNQLVIAVIRRIVYFMEIEVLSPLIILLLSMGILHICNIIFSMKKLSFTIGKMKKNDCDV